ncbi:MAG: hypothetical protein M1818_006570 [Claussenomyces sp. TS43310]|nr:MAG: hypothetical protein M1818_006570 [Claussenomyces sp. TS43310]
MSADVVSSHSRQTTQEAGPFVLRTLLENVPLSAEGDGHDITINCVDFLGSNLYVGTSASEILHFVQIPPNPAESSGQASYILASRLPPYFSPSATSERPGVQQILLLPKVNKACVLCNSTVTFYSLPELSPVYGNTHVQNCNWVGGLDLNDSSAGDDQDAETATVTVLLSLKKILRPIKVGVEAKGLKPVEFAGSTISVRRDSIACVADRRSYALLDVMRQLKIPLFPISSLDESQSSKVGGQAEDISSNSGSGIRRSASTVQKGGHPTTTTEDHEHARSTSLGSRPSRRQGQAGGTIEQSGRETPDRLFRDTSPAPETTLSRSIQREISPNNSISPEKPLPAPPPEATIGGQVTSSASISPVTYLRPHVVSPSPQEFLLVTGTGPSDPGVGIFVNLEGDVTRSTLEFTRYPDGLVTDGRGLGVDLSQNNADDDEEGFVLASMAREADQSIEYGLEIQRWDIDPGEGDRNKFWLPVSCKAKPDDEAKTALYGPGLRSLADCGDLNFEEVIERLRLKRFRAFSYPLRSASTSSIQSADSRTAASMERVSGERDLFEAQKIEGESLREDREQDRNEEEFQFARRLGHARTRVVAWSGDRIWWIVRNPLSLRLDAALEATKEVIMDGKSASQFSTSGIVETINDLRGREAKSETEFMSLGYIRQHAGLLLLISLINPKTRSRGPEDRIAAEALLEGSLDPRVILALIPALRNEVIEGKGGIWVHGGVKDTAASYIMRGDADRTGSLAADDDYVLQFMRRFLSAWRRKKGFGSIADENEVFLSVDAALLVVLLELDKSSTKGPVKVGSIRADLYHLVDHGMDCFDRAVAILESYHRLYVLSRLYQSRKMSSDVLATWRRIIEGEADEGAELSDGEQIVRNYLSNVRNPALVQEYGVWLAGRNTKLGIQVFADDRSSVKFEVAHVVEVLRRGAPAAVKDYLEHLVFGKNHTEYVNELITYYLDIVISKLETSDEARAILSQSYESYRALHPPKPTYQEFVTDNAIQEEWWQGRLRLLQLLGGSHGSASEYDVASILARITPFTQELVPEVTILYGRQSQHEEALKLLTHGLGDYDTAINYCLLGGSSIYHPISGGRSGESLPSRAEQAKLFGYLLTEFLSIEDISDRVEQTGSLLERFGSWFDVGYVLKVIPDTWSVELISAFLINALRRMVRERSETMVVKALSGTENLKINADLIHKIEEIGPSIEGRD